MLRKKRTWVKPPKDTESTSVPKADTDIISTLFDDEEKFGSTAWKGQPGDILVLVIGPAGVGKSTFVKHLIRGRVDWTEVEIGEDLESCTVNLQPIEIPPSHVPIPIEVRGSRLVIVDTPGFDDTYTDNSKILNRIAKWLTSCYNKTMKLCGIIYLHDISQPRISNTTRANFEQFQALCGKSGANFVILGTTKWSLVPTDVEKKREEQLCEKFWGDMLKDGMTTEHFENNSDSAWKIVKTLLLDPAATDLDARILRIQNELVELVKNIPTTDAGKLLRSTLEEVLEMQKSPPSQSAGKEYSAKMTEKLQRIERLVALTDQLKVPKWHRLKNFLRGKLEEGKAT